MLSFTRKRLVIALVFFCCALFALVKFGPIGNAMGGGAMLVPSITAAGVPVSLPNVNATPGSIAVPITVGSLTGLNAISYDLNIDFNPAVVTPASPAFTQAGTISVGMSVTPNSANAGHLIISAFQGQALSGSGTLIILNFNVVGTPGQSTPLDFIDYTDPGGNFHPGFVFNEGDPLSKATDGSVTIPGGSTPTSSNTDTPTPTNTPTPANTPTATATATLTPTATNTPTNIPTNTPANTPTSAPTATASATPTGPQYQIFDIGVVLPTDTASQGFGVSAGGVAVGRSVRTGGAQAFTYIGGPGIAGLPNLAGRSFAVANAAIDSGAGTVVGTAANTLFGTARLPVIWHGGVVSQLPLPAGETLGDAFDINSSMIAVGSVNGGSSQRGVIYDGATGTIITQTTSNGSFFTTAFGINDGGRIAGIGIDPNNAARNVPMVYEIGAGSAIDIGALPGFNSAIAFGIGNSGHVVGSSMLNQGSGLPFIWTSGGGMAAIPLPIGTTQGSARGVNLSGWAVGTASSAFAIPFVYTGTATYRLADLIPAGTGWDLSTNTSSSAMGISDGNIIVGTGVLNGVVHAYSMVPAGGTPTATATNTSTATNTPTNTATATATSTGTPAPTCTPATAPHVVPPAYTGTTGTSAFLGPLANTPRTYQLLIHANQLTGIVGQPITALTWRLPASATAAWPAADVNFTNYDIRLSGSVDPANRSLTDFSANVVGPQTLVRSGPLTITTGSYTSGSSPNTFGPDIAFDMPWVYSGGNLLIELRHDGFTGTSRSVDALSTTTAGYGTDFSAAWTGSYTGTSGVQGNFSVASLVTGGTGCPSPSETPTNTATSTPTDTPTATPTDTPTATPTPGSTNPLFAGVDDIAIPAALINVTNSTSVPAFSGFQVWGAAFDPINNKVYFNSGTTLLEWPVGGTVTTLGPITDTGGALQSMVGLAFYNGNLYGTKNIANEAIYLIDTTTRIATVHIDYVDGDVDCGGFEADPNTGAFYCTNDDATPHGAGLARINGDATVTTIVPYPVGETDVDGLAISPDGKAYMVTDNAAGPIYVYDLVSGTFGPQLTAPWPTSETFSGATWIGAPGGTPTPTATASPTPTSTATATNTATPIPSPMCPPAPGFVYALNDDSNGSFVYGFQVNQTTGALTALAGLPVAAGLGGINSIVSERMTIDRTNARLYVINDSSDSVSAYSINLTTGALTAMPFSPISLGAGVWNTIAVHQSGSPLVVASNATNGLVHSFAITGTTATAATGSPYNMGAAVAGFSSRMAEFGNYYYVGGNQGAGIGGFSVDPANGALTTLAGSPFASGAVSVLAYATDSTGRLYSVDTVNGIRAFTSASGALSPVTGNPFASGLTQRRFGLVHEYGAAGTLYFVAGNSGNNVGVFQVSGSGAATTVAPIAGSPFATGGTTANALAMNEGGDLLFVANRISRNITTFRVSTIPAATVVSLGVQPSNTMGTTGAINGIGYITGEGGGCGTATPTNTPTATNTPTFTPTATATSTNSPTNTPTVSPDTTATNTPTRTATATPTATGTPPSIQFSSATYIEDESQVASITITRTGNVSGTNTVFFSTVNGTATGGAACTTGVDYLTLTNQTVTFNPGDTSRTMNVTICSDSITEPDQAVVLALAGSNIGSPSPALLTINDTASLYRSTASICTTFGGPGAPYPSTITVSGGPASIGSIRATLYDVAHTIPDDMDFLLVGPTGQKFILMADAGGVLDLVTPVSLTFSDSAGQVLPNSAPLTTGVFEPTSWEPGQSSFAAPAPPAPYNEPGSTVGGTGTQTLIGNFGTTNANGVWSLYMRDDAGSFTNAITGCVNGGWGLEVFGSTAASASISGRVMTANGQGIRNAKVVVMGNSLSEPLVAATGSFGYFTFEGLATGETYVVTVNARRYTFSTPSRVISLVDNVVDADFIADPQE